MHSAPDDPEARSKLLAGLRAGRSVAAAAREAGYSRTHVYKLADRDRVVREALAQLQARGGRGRKRKAPEGEAQLEGELPPGDVAELRQLALGALRNVLEAPTTSARDLVAAARAALAVAPASRAPAAPAPAPAPEDQGGRLLRLMDAARKALEA